jgi:hypothetical protein
VIAVTASERLAERDPCPATAEAERLIETERAGYVFRVNAECRLVEAPGPKLSQ